MRKIICVGLTGDEQEGVFVPRIVRVLKVVGAPLGLWLEVEESPYVSDNVYLRVQVVREPNEPVRHADGYFECGIVPVGLPSAGGHPFSHLGTCFHEGRYVHVYGHLDGIMVPG